MATIVDEPSNPENEQGGPSAAGFRWRFAVLLIVLAVLVVLIGRVQRADDARWEGALLSESAMQGDVAMKLSYAFGRWAASAPAGGTGAEQMERLRESQRRSAAEWYGRAVREKLAAANIRRLIIAEDASGRAQAIDQLWKADYSQLGLPGREAVDAEADMWHDIYLARRRLAAEQVDDYQSKIRGMELGWHEHLALADLFDRAGMPTQARELRDQAARRASSTAVKFLALLSILTMLGTAGVALIALYLLSRRSGRLRARDAISELPVETRYPNASSLLEAFVVYLVILVVVQVAAVGAVVGVEASRQGGISDLAMLVMVAAYVLSGLLALAYLARHLRSRRQLWEAIGFRSRGPMVDVAWGVGGYAAALPLLGLASVVSQFIGRYVSTPPNPVIPLFSGVESLVGRLILFALAVVAAPFFEELFFRGVLYGSFRRAFGITAGILLSSVVFAVVHPLPGGFLPILVLGLVFAILVYQRGSLLPAVVAHGLNNAVAFTMLLILLES